VKKYADFFAELCLQDYAFQRFLPSTLAAGVVACARRAVKIEPIWNAELTALTTYDVPQVFGPYRQLFAYYVDSFPSAQTNTPLSRAVVQFEEEANKQLKVPMQEQRTY
jgi:hypothetical protein